MTDTNRSTVTRWKALCEVCWPLPQSSVATQVAGTTAPIVDVVGRVLNATLLSRAPKVTGDSLFEALFDDKITPPLAELIAKQRGLPPLAPQPNPADYNPMLEPSWTPAMTIAWIAYRSDTEVVEVWDLYRCKCTFWLKRSLEFRKPATLRWMRMFEKSRPGAIGIHDAIQELLSALIGNKLQATGVKVDTRERVLLPGHEWHGLKFVDVRGCLVVRFRDGSLLTARGYDDVKFRSQDITEIWPARRLAMDGPPVPQAEPPAESAKPAALTEVTGEEAAADRELNDEGRATSARGSAETGESDAGKEPARSGGAGAAAEGQERKTDPAPAASLAKEEEEAETALDRRELNDAAVRAVITLVDTGGDVADACRQVAESLDAEGKRQFPHIKKWTSLRKAYYRKAGKVSLDTVSVSMDTGTDTPKLSTGARANVLKVSIPFVAPNTGTEGRAGEAPSSAPASAADAAPKPSEPTDAALTPAQSTSETQSESLQPLPAPQLGEPTLADSASSSVPRKRSRKTSRGAGAQARRTIAVLDRIFKEFPEEGKKYRDRYPDEDEMAWQDVWIKFTAEYPRYAAKHPSKYACPSPMTVRRVMGRAE